MIRHQLIRKVTPTLFRYTSKMRSTVGFSPVIFAATTTMSWNATFAFQNTVYRTRFLSGRSFTKSSSLNSVEPLTPLQLRWRCNPDLFKFQTTAELENLDGIMGLLGQERAKSAIEFGVNMKREGYNLYVLGPPGTGKRTIVRHYLDKFSRGRPPPFDWCYVHNFIDTDQPKAIRLPAGLGRHLEKDVDQFIEEVKTAIPEALDDEEHKRKLEESNKSVFQEHEKALEEFVEEGKASKLMIVRTPNGLVLAGRAESENVTAEEEAIAQGDLKRLLPRFDDLMRELSQLKKLAREKSNEINREGARNAIEYLIAPLKETYATFDDVLTHLDAIEVDLVKNYDRIKSPDDETPLPLAFLQQHQQLNLAQYQVNLMVDNTDSADRAPVVYEEHPYYHNLMGRIDYSSTLGQLITNFSLIKAGALHRANGGYLVLQARDVLMQPFSWEALKRALRSRKASIESLGDELSLISTLSLKPEPIELNVKVVLLGDRLLYYMLQSYDPDFNELFKVQADFNEEMDRSEEACELYARMLATLGKTEETRPLDRDAVAAIIEQSARMVGDQDKLSTHIRSCTDLLRESDYWAQVDGAEVIGGDHVLKALELQVYRADRIRELMYEQIKRGTLMIDLEGEQVGQVNGLSVMAAGTLAFGRPSRIKQLALDMEK